MTSATHVRQAVGAVLLGLGLAQTALVAGNASQPEATPPAGETHGHAVRECDGALSIGEFPDGVGAISIELDEATDGTGSLEIRIRFDTTTTIIDAEDATPTNVEEVEKVEIDSGGTSSDDAVAATPGSESADDTECVSIVGGGLRGSWAEELPIGIHEAIDIARDHADGQLESVVLEHAGDASTYTITIGGEEVVIDAKTGEVTTPAD